MVGVRVVDRGLKYPGTGSLKFREIWDGVWLGLGWSTGLGFKLPGHRVLKFREMWDGYVVRVRVVGVRVSSTRA